MSAKTAVLDACVLYPAPLRDLLMELALTGLFRARWSDEIHDEWIRNLLTNRPELKDKIKRVRTLMNRVIPDCLVADYANLIPGLSLPDPNDRHVLAAAIKCQAAVIVTYNLKDFPVSCLSRYGVEPLHPDDFICRQFDLDAPTACRAIKTVRARLKNPQKTLDQYIETLSQQSLPGTIQRMKSFGSRL